MSNNFFAMMHRMRYINRWGLMRNTENENIQEHSLEVAIIAHALAVLRNKQQNKDLPPVDAKLVVLMALYHDASEILTGDLPTPVKYFNPAIQQAYKAVESVAADKLLSMLPPELAGDWQPLLSPDLNDPQVNAAYRLIKAADRISAYIKCLDEAKAGNTEFRQAQETVLASIDSLCEDLPEVRVFLDLFLPAFELSLDQLQ